MASETPHGPAQPGPARHGPVAARPQQHAFRTRFARELDGTGPARHGPCTARARHGTGPAQARPQVHAFRTRFARELDGRLVVFPAPSPACTAPTSAPGRAAPPAPEPARPSPPADAPAAAQEQPAGVCAAAWALDTHAALPYVHAQIVEAQVPTHACALACMAAGASAHSRLEADRNGLRAHAHARLSMDGIARRFAR
jgi:hypothetical protein